MIDNTCPKRVILASASPRRREKLSRLLAEYDVMATDCAELSSGRPETVALQNAYNKAWAAFDQNRDAIVIGADTVVVIDGIILGKPRDERDALAMLMRLSGRRHSVLTGLCIMSEGKCKAWLDRSYVQFREFTESEALDYIATGEPMDKAGSYAIQAGGARFVEKYEGDYDNIVGMSVNSVGAALEGEFGIAVLPH